MQQCDIATLCTNADPGIIGQRLKVLDGRMHDRMDETSRVTLCAAFSRLGK